MCSNPKITSPPRANNIKQCEVLMCIIYAAFTATQLLWVLFLLMFGFPQVTCQSHGSGRICLRGEPEAFLGCKGGGRQSESKVRRLVLHHSDSQTSAVLTSTYKLQYKTMQVRGNWRLICQYCEALSKPENVELVWQEHGEGISPERKELKA